MNICAFIGDMYRDYSTQVIMSLQNLAIARGHHIDVFGNCAVPNENPLDAEGLKSILRLPILTEYDGIILCADTLDHAGINKDLLEMLKTTPDLPPVISLRSDEPGFINILPDNRQVMREITNHVLDIIKSDDVGFVRGREDLKDSHERYAGFAEAMTEAGYDPQKAPSFHGNYWVDQGPETADFFTRKDGTFPRAIICSNDYMATALMDELLKRGFNIPEDVLVTGVDNFMMSENHIPSLTTSEIREEEIAELAIDYLEKIEAGETVPKHSYIKGHLIVRESTGGTPQKDVFNAYKRLEKIQQAFYAKTFAFVWMNSDYDIIMTYKECMDATFRYLKISNFFTNCYYCTYGENDRSLRGICDKDTGTMCDIPFPQKQLLPKRYNNQEPGIRIFLPVNYRNVVYGYLVGELDPASETFFDERLEFMLILFGQTINKLELYERVSESENIMDLYQRDALTGIYNRRGFEKHISDMFKTEGFKIAVASIDMDDLKGINDSYGHAAGDDAIKAIANCIRASLNPGEFVARMGGDEFEAVLNVSKPERIGQFIRSFRDAMTTANKSLKGKYTLSASIGTCEVPEWSSLMECMNRADKVMYLEKNSKKSRHNGD